MIDHIPGQPMESKAEPSEIDSSAVRSIQVNHSALKSSTVDSTDGQLSDDGGENSQENCETGDRSLISNNIQVVRSNSFLGNVFGQSPGQDETIPTLPIEICENDNTDGQSANCESTAESLVKDIPVVRSIKDDHNTSDSNDGIPTIEYEAVKRPKVTIPTVESETCDIVTEESLKLDHITVRGSEIDRSIEELILNVGTNDGNDVANEQIRNNIQPMQPKSFWDRLKAYLFLLSPRQDTTSQTLPTATIPNEIDVIDHTGEESTDNESKAEYSSIDRPTVDSTKVESSNAVCSSGEHPEVDSRTVISATVDIRTVKNSEIDTTAVKNAEAICMGEETIDNERRYSLGNDDMADDQSLHNIQPVQSKSVLDQTGANVLNQSSEQDTDPSQLGKELSEMSVQLENANVEIEIALDDMIDIENRLEDAQIELEKALKESKSAKLSSETLKEENEMLINEIAQLKKEIVECVTQAKNLQDQFVTHEMSHEQEIGEKETIIRSLTNDMLRSNSEKIDSMSEQMKLLQASLSEKETIINRLNESITGLNAGIEQKTTENTNLTESIRLLKKSNQNLTEQTDSQMENIKSLIESNEALSAMASASKNKSQQLEKDLKQSVVDKNVLTDIKQENERLRSDSQMLKERIKKAKSNENVKAVSSSIRFSLKIDTSMLHKFVFQNKIASLQSQNKYLLASNSDLLKDAKKLEENLLEIQLENHIQAVSRSEIKRPILNAVMANKIKSKSVHVETGIGKIIDDLTRDCIRHSAESVRRQSDNVVKETKQIKNQTNASIFCTDLPIGELNCIGELIRLCKLIIESHCIDALSLDELRLLHEYVYIAGLRKQTIKFPYQTLDVQQHQMQVDQLKKELSSAKMKMAQLKSQELFGSGDNKL